MEITLLIKSIAGLILILGFLIFLMISSSKNKKKSKQLKIIKDDTLKATAPQNEPIKIDLESLRAIIKDKESDKYLLKEALELIIKYHGTIPNKLGLRANPAYEIYQDILFTICRHPHTNKNLILYFDKYLSKLNPEYKSDLNDTLMRGLNSRGF